MSVIQCVPTAGQEGPQAGPQLVAVRPDGLERGAVREADLALHAVDLGGGGEPVAVLVDALGDAHAAARGRLGTGRLRRRAVGAGFSDGGVHRLSPHGRVLASGPLDLADDHGVGGHGRFGQMRLSGLSLTSCQTLAGSGPARLTTRPSAVRTT